MPSVFATRTDGIIRMCWKESPEGELKNLHWGAGNATQTCSDADASHLGTLGASALPLFPLAPPVFPQMVTAFSSPLDVTAESGGEKLIPA